MSGGFLTYSSVALAQQRTQQQASANGCDGVQTVYWWEYGGGTAHLNGYVPPTALGALIVVGPTPPFNSTYLTPTEIAALQSAAQLQAAGWTVPAQAEG